MKSNIFGIIFSVLVSVNVSSNSSPKNVKKNPIERYGYLDTLIEDLQSQKWGKEEATCLKQLEKILLNVQNSTTWATWIWDSMQTPVGQLYGSKNHYGNYDECLEFPWEQVHPDLRTQYCMAHITLGPVDSKLDEVDLFGHVENYLRAKSKNHLKFNTLAWGICAPVVCEPHSVSKLVGSMFRQTHLGIAVDKPEISLSNCYIAGKTEDAYNFGYYFSWSLVAFFIILSLVSTSYVNHKGLGSNGMAYFNAFYIPRNLQFLSKVTEDDIGPLFGIRVMACFCITLFHIWILTTTLGVTNSIRLDKDFEPKKLTMFLHLEVAVDTFLFMSGFLLIKGLAHNGFKTFNPLKVLVKRYFRLIIPVSIILLLAFRGLNHVIQGPVRNDFFQKESDVCDQHWFDVFLMIQNYMRPENMCYPVLWSVSCDFQLTVLGTMIAWVFTKSRKFGLLFFLTSFIASIVLPAAFAFTHRDLSVIPPDFRLLDNYKDSLLGNPLYAPTHYRGGSYLVGVALGYLMSIYNPVNHRNILSKKFSILSLCVLLVMFVEFFIASDTIARQGNTAFVVALYVSLKRIIWAGFIAILVMLCEYGTLPVLPSFLSWSAWVPISRLSYGIYLIHITLVTYRINATRSPLQYDLINLIVHTLGVTVFSSIVSLAVWTFYEAPLGNIVSLLLKTKPKSQEIQKDKAVQNLGDLKKIEALQGNVYEKSNKL
ncbi:O-acyltransferase like protein-like [Epargyreus clarus]|uniref:O-acyltransferase like protein-like n=1 Tax=Epargyreus clarus TaxID=520877 RepID=UPI003C2E5427